MSSPHRPWGTQAWASPPTAVPSPCSPVTRQSRGLPTPGRRGVLWPRLLHSSNPSGVTPPPCPSRARVAGACSSSTGISGPGASDLPGGLSGRGAGAAFPKPPGGGALCSRADLGKYWPPRPSAASGLGGCQPPGALPTRRELATEDVHRASSCSGRARFAHLPAGRRPCAPCPGLGHAFLGAPPPCPPGSSTW